MNCSNGRAYNSECFFDCNTGYELLGERRLTCQANGSYDNLKPICKSEL